MNILYIDPIHGISGDMTIGALIDAGCPFEALTALLAQLPVELPSMEAEKRRKGALEGTYLRIGHSHVHLPLPEMEALIDGLKAPDRVKRDARGILDVLAQAEAKVHGVTKAEVHFHELSHIDTIIDVVGVAAAMAHFNIDKVLCGPIPQGKGFITTAHGIMPNPAPATAEILRGLDVLFLDEELELTTPTGAAIVRYYVTEQARIPFRVTAVGYGFGTVETTRPNALRVFVGEAGSAAFDEEVWVVEADMDDAQTEYMGAVGDRLRSAGALDVVCLPIQMKKGRPGLRLSVLAPASLLGALSEMIFTETTTFGLRMRPEFRSVLARKEEVCATSFGPVRVKRAYAKDGTLIKSHIEYEDVKKIADEKGLPYGRLLDALKKEL
jgi:uncharacterized protein (TIGR00299 family) protein